MAIRPPYSSALIRYRWLRSLAALIDPSQEALAFVQRGRATAPGARDLVDLSDNMRRAAGPPPQRYHPVISRAPPIPAAAQVPRRRTSSSSNSDSSSGHSPVSPADIAVPQPIVWPPRVSSHAPPPPPPAAAAPFKEPKYYDMPLEVYADGSCFGNGKARVRSHALWGATQPA